MREYNRDHTDLSVKIPGGVIEAKRWYFNNKWYFEHLRHNLKFNMDSLGTGIKSIDKSEITYDVSSINTDLFKNDTYRIKKTETGYRWENKLSTWKEFDHDGRMTSYGTRDKTLGKLLYEEGENGKLIGIADRNDVQVIWYEHNGDLISAVRDTENRRVEYGYTGGLLTSVTDLLSNDTIHEYDGEGKIIKTVDVEGRESNVTYDNYGNVASVLDNNGNGHFFVFGYDEGNKETNVRITTSSGKIKEVWYDRFGKTKRVDVNGRTLKCDLPQYYHNFSRINDRKIWGDFWCFAKLKRSSGEHYDGIGKIYGLSLYHFFMINKKGDRYKPAPPGTLFNAPTSGYPLSGFLPRISPQGHFLRGA